jgi:hypothetical protein
MATPITQKAGTNYGSAPKTEEVTVDAGGKQAANFPRMSPLKQTAFSDIKVDDTGFNYTPSGYTGLNMNAQLPTIQANQTLMAGGGAPSAGSTVTISSEETGQNQGENANNNFSIEGMRQNYIQTGLQQSARMRDARKKAKEMNLEGAERKSYLKKERQAAKDTKHQARVEYTGGSFARVPQVKAVSEGLKAQKGNDSYAKLKKGDLSDLTKSAKLMPSPANMWGNAKIQFGRKKNK